jgi:hypothetical protein
VERKEREDDATLNKKIATKASQNKKSLCSSVKSLDIIDLMEAKWICIVERGPPSRDVLETRRRHLVSSRPSVVSSRLVRSLSFHQ